MDAYTCAPPPRSASLVLFVPHYISWNALPISGRWIWPVADYFLLLSLVDQFQFIYERLLLSHNQRPLDRNLWVPEHYTVYIFPIPLPGVHHEVEQQLASKIPPLLILYGWGVIMFLGSALARPLTSSPTWLQTTTSWATTAYSLTWIHVLRTRLLPPHLYLSNFMSSFPSTSLCSIDLERGTALDLVTLQHAIDRGRLIPTER